MEVIQLKKIRIYAYHGCLVEESKIGSQYIVNLTVKGDFSLSAETDLLKDTADYVRLNRIVKEEMALRSKLLETVCKRILGRVLDEIPLVLQCEVSIAKQNPPIGGDVAEVAVIMNKKRR